MSANISPGRRISDRAAQARRKVDPLLAVGIVAVALSLVALSGMKASDQSDPEPVREARYRPLTSQALSCPASTSRGSVLMVGSLPGAGADGEAEGGSVTGRPSGAAPRPLDLVSGEVSTVALGERALVVAGSGSSAPGLFGARVSPSSPPAFAECVAPAAEVWFNGAGAGGLHESKLLLVNPDQGPAVADVTLWTTTGKVDAPTVRGLTVPGGSSKELDLAEVAPTREELTIRVAVTRGRIASSMVDTYTPRGGKARTDGLPSSQAPAKDVLVPGFPRKSNEATLAVANPGADAARVRLTVVGAKSEFQPRDFPEIRVPAGQVIVQELSAALTRLVASEDATLHLTSSAPVTAGVRVVVGGDFAHLPSVAPVHGDAVSIVPTTGERTLVLSTPATAGAVNLEFVGATEPARATLATRVRPKTSTAIEVPAGTRAVVVRSSAITAGVVRTTTPRGISIAPLRPLMMQKVIPDVRPEW